MACAAFRLWNSDCGLKQLEGTQRLVFQSAFLNPKSEIEQEVLT
jgi:hypothetical protein